MNRTHPNLQRVFEQAFSVRDIAVPLISFDDATPSQQVREIMLREQLELVGIRSQGVVTSFVELPDLETEHCGEAAHPISISQIVSDALPLVELILRLKDTPGLFVESLGQIGGTVSRNELLQPPARMWLFGMITLIEMRFSRMIEQYCPNESWKASLSEGRIEKAGALLAERSRRNQQVNE